MMRHYGITKMASIRLFMMSLLLHITTQMDQLLSFVVRNCLDWGLN